MPELSRREIDLDWVGRLRLMFPRRPIFLGIKRGSKMDIITRLEEAREKTLRYFDLTGGQLDLSYGPGKWTVRFILHHLADGETVLYDRIRRVLSEPRQVLWAFDQDAWARGLDYSGLPLDLSRRIYDAVRTGIIYQARLHYESDGYREFVHSQTGLRTLKAEFDKVASHNEHHLAQIELALSAPQHSAVAKDRRG
jgi:hypothetical protein